GADDSAFYLPTIVEGDGQRLGVVDDVVVGEDVGGGPIGLHNDARAGTLLDELAAIEVRNFDGSVVVIKRQHAAEGVEVQPGTGDDGLGLNLDHGGLDGLVDGLEDRAEVPG